jgi:hypothetical protein
MKYGDAKSWDVMFVWNFVAIALLLVSVFGRWNGCFCKTKSVKCTSFHSLAGVAAYPK